MMKKFFSLLIISMCVGCSVPVNFSLLNAGMDKQEVEKAIGAPDHITATSNSVVLYVYERDCDIRGDNCTNYMVKFEYGKVVQYGQAAQLGYTEMSHINNTPINNTTIIIQRVPSQYNNGNPLILKMP